MDFRPDQILELAENGQRVQIVRKTGSGNYKVKMLESMGARLEGLTIFVSEDRLREKQVRPQELEQRYEESKEAAIWQLQHYVKRAQGARQKVADAILNGGYEALANEVRWGNGVKEDLAGALAERVLETMEKGHTLEQSMEWMIEELERQMLRNQNDPTSTSPFSNAVAITRNEVARDVRDSLSRDLRHLNACKADIVVASL